MEEVEEEMVGVVADAFKSKELDGLSGLKLYQTKMWNSLEDPESSQVAKVNSIFLLHCNSSKTFPSR